MNRAGLPLGDVGGALGAHAGGGDCRRPQPPDPQRPDHVRGSRWLSCLRFIAGPGAAIDGLIGAILAFVLLPARSSCWACWAEATPSS